MSKKTHASEESIQVTVKERDYYVGKMAERFGVLPEYVFGRERFDGEAAEVLVWTALSMLAPDNESIDLTLDYPYSQFHSVKDKLSSRLRGKTETVGRYQSTPVTMHINSVTEYPQSLVAAYALSPTMPELFNGEQDGYIAIVDIGGDTTDVVVLETFGGDVIIHEEISGTIAHGTRDLTQVIRRSLEATTGDILDTELADRVVQSGSVYYGGRDWNFCREVEQAKKDLAIVLKSRISDLWGTRQNRVRTTIFVGGGALMLESELQGFHPNQVIATDAQWKNAEGCLLANTQTDTRDEPSQQPRVHETPSTDSVNNGIPTHHVAETKNNNSNVEETNVNQTKAPIPPEPLRETNAHVQTPNLAGAAASVPGRFREGASAWQ